MYSGLSPLSWVPKLKPFFDAYLGPYKDKYRYWTGLLLLVRILLLVIFSVNVLGDPNINLLAVAHTITCLLIVMWQSGGVYKKWPLNVLECSFLLNLSALSTTTLYIRLSGGNQAIAAYISSGVAFVTFFGILLYHIYCRFWKTFMQKRENVVQQVTVSTQQDSESIAGAWNDRMRRVPSVSVVSISELREPLLEYV